MNLMQCGDQVQLGMKLMIASARWITSSITAYARNVRQTQIIKQTQVLLKAYLCYSPDFSPLLSLVFSEEDFIHKP